VAGEIWEARSADSLVVGDEVEVTGVDGLTLQVSRLRRAPR
jgi:membrane protein implicated in regulation of membrane protease activity